MTTVFRLGLFIFLFIVIHPLMKAENRVNNIRGLRSSYRESFHSWDSVDVDAVDAKGRPTYVSGAIGNVGSGEKFNMGQLIRVLDRYLAPFGLNHADLKKTGDNLGAGGHRVLRYEQVLRGKPLVGSGLSLMIAASGDIRYISSNLTDEHVSFAPVERVTKSRAGAKALTADSRYNSVAAVSVEPILRLDNVTGNIWFAHEVHVGRGNGRSEAVVYIDAADEKVLGLVPLKLH